MNRPPLIAIVYERVPKLDVTVKVSPPNALVV
jgi:hypothetical protein